MVAVGDYAFCRGRVAGIGTGRASRESLSVPRSERVEGVLTVGRKVTPAGVRRFGVWREGSRERRVVVMDAVGYQPGQILKVRGRFFVPRSERNPGSFSRLDQWRRQGVSGGLVVNEAELIEVDFLSAPLRWAEAIRGDLSKAITRGIPDETSGRQVIQAMVLGEKPPRNSKVSRAFRESGAMHVFAVSGLHVTWWVWCAGSSCDLFQSNGVLACL